jgi:hypothetical protein
VSPRSPRPFGIFYFSFMALNQPHKPITLTAQPTTRTNIPVSLCGT